MKPKPKHEFHLINHGVLVQKQSLRITTQHAGIKNAGLRKRGHAARWVILGPRTLADLLVLFDEQRLEARSQQLGASS